MKNNRIHTILTLIIPAIISIGCSEKTTVEKTDDANAMSIQTSYSELVLSPMEYIEWFKRDENPLHKSQIINQVQYSLEYRSPEFLALIQSQDENITKAELDSAMNDMGDLMQFRLEIEVPNSGKEFLKHNLESDVEYEERVKYFAFELQKDICLLNAQGDTIPCAMFHFERSYNASPSSVFLLGFAGINTENNLEIIIKERVFAKKEIRFVFSSEELKNIPQLKTL